MNMSCEEKCGGDWSEELLRLSKASVYFVKSEDESLGDFNKALVLLDTENVAHKPEAMTAFLKTAKDDPSEPLGILALRCAEACLKKWPLDVSGDDMGYLFYIAVSGNYKRTRRTKAISILREVYTSPAFKQETQLHIWNMFKDKSLSCNSFIIKSRILRAMGDIDVPKQIRLKDIYNEKEAPERKEILEGPYRGGFSRLSLRF